MKLFSKTWQNDWPWLKLAITSVLKTCTEPIDWRIVCDDGTREDVKKVIDQALQAAPSKHGEGYRKDTFEVVEVSERFPEAMKIQSGYMRQQWVKMNAHKVMGSGIFWNWDSDVIAVKPFGSSIFCNPQGKPVHFFTPLNNLLMTEKDPTAIEAHKGRRHITEICLDYNHVCFEFMRCMPAPLIGEILAHASTQREWDRAYEVMKSGDHRLSEFNIIGQYCHLYYPDAFEWKNASNYETWSGGYVLQGEKIVYQQHAYVAQGWSWNGIPAEVAKFVEEL